MLLQIDDLTRPNHPYLQAQDECHYLLEYTPKQGYNFSATNQLILNLKKSPDRQGKSDYHYKAEAILQAGDMLRSSLNEEWLASGPTFVPIPCSKSKTHLLYDDRMIRVLRRLTRGSAADVRELIVQTEDLECFHEGYRLRPDQLARYYELDTELLEDSPREVVLFDDMLTTGCHFKAAQSAILQHWPDGVPIAGIFLARVVRPEVSTENLLDFFG